MDDVLDGFRKQVATLIDQVAQIDNEVFRKAMYVSMIDALSACAYDGMRPGERFKRFVREIGNWRDAERVSLPQAALFFQGDGAMLNAIEALLANWQWGQTQSITSDPFPNQLPIRQTVWKVQHLNLLWQFRNCILHAFKDPGGMDLRTRNEPCYLGYLEPDTSGVGLESKRKWRLVIPETFLRRLLTESLDGLIAFCRREGRDPQFHLNRPLWV